MRKDLFIFLTVVITVFLSFSLTSFAAGWNENNTYEKEDGNLATGAFEIEGVWYLFDEEGFPVEKICFVNDSLYEFAFNEEGKAAGTLYTGEYKEKRYKNGKFLTGTYDGKRYKNGVLYTGFYKNYYYKSGTKYVPSKAGLSKISGKYYYFTSKGKNIRPSKKGVHKMGNGRYYYFYSSGTVRKASKKGINKIGKKAYYYKTYYQVVCKSKNSFVKLKGKTYRISRKGYLVSGWVILDGKKYYMSKNDYHRFQGGIKSVNGSKYWFSKKGVVQKKKWKYKNGLKRYYFGKKGKMVKNCSKYIGKYKYYFNKKGVCQTNLIKYKGYNWVLSHSLKVNVNRKQNTVTIYAKNGSKGYTIPVIAFICTTGSYDRPTDKGNYRTGQIYRWKELGGKTETEDNGEKCYGQYVTHIYGNVYFHSVVYEEKGNNHTLYTSAYNWLGNSGSHGCIRLRCGDAYKMYRLASSQSMWVHIYDSSYKGAFGKPALKKISTNYDPTDPNI